MLNLVYQNCYYFLNASEQLLKWKTWELFTIALRHSSETSRLFLGTWWIRDLFTYPLVTWKETVHILLFFILFISVKYAIFNGIMEYTIESKLDLLLAIAYWPLVAK